MKSFQSKNKRKIKKAKSKQKNLEDLNKKRIKNKIKGLLNQILSSFNMPDGRVSQKKRKEKGKWHIMEEHETCRETE